MQWSKHGLCFIVLISQVIVNLIRGSKSARSLLEQVGIHYGKCTWYDFVFSGMYLVICVIVTLLAIR